VPWWSWIWIAVLSLFYVAGAVDDWEDRVARWKIFLDAVELLLTMGFVFAFYVKPLAESFGRSIIFFVAVAVLWSTIRTLEELPHIPPDPELSAKANKSIKTWATVSFLVLVIPAWIMGIITAIEQW